MSARNYPARRFIELRKHRRFTSPPGSLLSFIRLIRSAGAPEDEAGDATLLDLSPAGCKIASETVIPLGEPYRLILQLPFCPVPINIETAIVRWINSDRFGFKFDAVEPDQEEHLREFLHRLRSSGS